MEQKQPPQPIVKRRNYIDWIKVGTNIFLGICILLLVWQYIKADAITKDIALSTDPTAMIIAYENITGYECLCGTDIINRVNPKKTPLPINTNISGLAGLKVVP